MPGLTIAEATEDDIDAVIALWKRCGLTREWNNPRADIALARAGTSSAVLVGRADGSIAASVMVGHDGHRGWFYYLSVDPAAQRQGYGRAIVEAAEQWLAVRSITKAMLMIRPDNAAVRAFYETLGYFDQPRTVLAKWLDGRPPTP
jgi:ribosomal protein S18 acetylase RimI-like enzyme